MTPVQLSPAPAMTSPRRCASAPCAQQHAISAAAPTWSTCCAKPSSGRYGPGRRDRPLGPRSRSRTKTAACLSAPRPATLPLAASTAPCGAATPCSGPRHPGRRLGPDTQHGDGRRQRPATHALHLFLRRRRIALQQALSRSRAATRSTGSTASTPSSAPRPLVSPPTPPTCAWRWPPLAPSCTFRARPERTHGAPGGAAPACPKVIPELRDRAGAG